jgi:hypothetical protein
MPFALKVQFSLPAALSPHPLHSVTPPRLHFCPPAFCAMAGDVMVTMMVPRLHLHRAARHRLPAPEKYCTSAAFHGSHPVIDPAAVRFFWRYYRKEGIRPTLANYDYRRPLKLVPLTLVCSEEAEGFIFVV